MTTPPVFAPITTPHGSTVVHLLFSLRALAETNSWRAAHTKVLFGKCSSYRIGTATTDATSALTYLHTNKDTPTAACQRALNTSIVVRNPQEGIGPHDFCLKLYTTYPALYIISHQSSGLALPPNSDAAEEFVRYLAEKLSK